MLRYLLAVLALFLFAVPASAGFDDTINELTAPIASAVGAIVFFKIPLFGAQLPLVVLWLVAGAVFFNQNIRLCHKLQEQCLALGMFLVPLVDEFPALERPLADTSEFLTAMPPWRTACARGEPKPRHPPG